MEPRVREDPEGCSSVLTVEVEAFSHSSKPRTIPTDGIPRRRRRLLRASSSWTAKSADSLRQTTRKSNTRYGHHPAEVRVRLSPREAISKPEKECCRYRWRKRQIRSATTPRNALPKISARPKDLGFGLGLLALPRQHIVFHLRAFFGIQGEVVWLEVCFQDILDSCEEFDMLLDSIRCVMRILRQI